jgi:BNR/Asp-box repeat protein
MVKRILIVLLALSSMPVLPSGASDPSSGTVSPTVSQIAFSGQVGVGPNPQGAGSENGCIEVYNCDPFELTVDVPEGFYDQNPRALTVTIKWADATNDLNLYLCRGSQTDSPQCVGGLVAGSSGDTNVETLSVENPDPGLYRVLTKASTGSSSYSGVITFLKAVPDKPVAPTIKRVTNAANGFGWMSTAVADTSGYAEPSVDVDHYGAVYVTAPGSGVQMWRSYDNGKTFLHKGIPGYGGDSEIEILANDDVLTADLEITDSIISRSDDRLDTFTQQPVGIEQDRQWLAHRCSNVVMLGYHDFVVEAEMVNRSFDGGLTWDTVPVFISPRGAAPGSQDALIYADQDINTFSGPIVIDQKTGDTYIVFAISTAAGNVTTGVPPFGEPTQVIVGVSHDEGATWTLKLVESGGVGTLAGLIFPWITLDRAGNVYASWAGRRTESEPINVFMAYSNDHGETWSEPYRVNNDFNGPAHLYTTMSAGDPGVVDIAWYTGTKGDPADTDQDWFVDFAQVRNANTQNPQITQSRVMPKSIHHGDICLNGLLCELGGDRSLLDFFQIQVGPDGMANIAFANNGTPDDNLRVWYARQTSGQSAGSGLHDSAHCPKAAFAGGPGPLPGSVIPPLPKPVTEPKVLGGNLAGTGVASYTTLALLMIAAAGAATVARFRFRRGRA